MGNELTTRRLLLIIAAGAVALVGFLGLWQPVYLADYDRYGIQIGCGSGFVADLSHAELADGGAGGHTGQCGHALLIRRAWATSVLIGGAAVVVAMALRGTRVVRHGQSQSTPG